MGQKSLFIFVEGPDDVRFFEHFKPVFEAEYDFYTIIEYSQKPLKYVKNYLKSIQSMGADYIFAGDINSHPCITRKKEKLLEKYNPQIVQDNIIIAIMEIESWYLAGLTEARSRSLKIKQVNKTDSITKEQFNSYIPKRFDSHIDFMKEILKKFSIPTARKKIMSRFSLKYD